MRNAKDVVSKDLGYICMQLEMEFGAMAGGKLLIMGGAGFLGYYLVQSVLHWNESNPEKKIEISVFDSYVRGVPDWLTDLDSKDSMLEVVRHDVTHPLPVGMKEFDYIIHAASIASPTFYRARPIETMDANVNGLRIMLNYSLERQKNGNPMQGFLFFSSSEIYGDPSPDQIPTSEDYRGLVSCTGPRACYDESKRFGETLCVNFARQHGIPVKMARPFNNYGPGLKITDRRVLPDFARDILAGKDIVLLSDGSPKRTFCYAADAIIGYYKILVKGRPGEAYNIGVETPEVSIAELADRTVGLAREIFDYQGKVVLGSPDDGDYLADNPNRRSPVIEKARRELGYAPEVDLQDGLLRSLLWYRDNAVSEEA